MRKIAAVLSALMLAVVMVGCSGRREAESNSNESSQPSEQDQIRDYLVYSSETTMPNLTEARSKLSQMTDCVVTDHAKTFELYHEIVALCEQAISVEAPSAASNVQKYLSENATAIENAAEEYAAASNDVLDNNLTKASERIDKAGEYISTMHSSIEEASKALTRMMQEYLAE